MGTTHIPPSVTDPALAALSTQLPLASSAGLHLDAQDEEELALGTPVERRESLTDSFVSNYTSGTDGQSLHSARSQATIMLQQSDAGHDSFADAQESFPRSGDSTSVLDHDAVHEAVQPAPPSPIAIATSPSAPIDNNTPRAIQPTTFSNLDTTPSLARYPSNDSGHEKKEETFPPLGSVAARQGRGGEKDSGCEIPPDTISLEAPELAHLTEEQRRIVAEQVCVLLFCWHRVEGGVWVRASAGRKLTSCTLIDSLRSRLKQDSGPSFASRPSWSSPSTPSGS